MSMLLYHRNAFVRKGSALLLSAPRAYRRLRANAASYRAMPPIICNSFPKSGTHLLVQLVEAFPNAADYGAYISSMTSSVVFRERSSASTVRAITSIVPTELVRAHLFYNEAFQKALSVRNAVHFFIMRDLRDVVVSEAHYLGDQNRWHRLHPYFSRLSSLEERISFSIRGGTGDDFPYYYPDVGQRFGRYAGWRHSDQVCWITFESLRSTKSTEAVQTLVEFYAQHCHYSIDVEGTVRAALSNIEPRKSHTFRKGEAGAWRQVFTPRLKDEMKEAAGQVLIDLGYERNLNW